MEGTKMISGVILVLLGVAVWFLGVPRIDNDIVANVARVVAGLLVAWGAWNIATSWVTWAIAAVAAVGYAGFRLSKRQSV